MHLEILSPSQIIFSDEVSEVHLPTAMGEIGILPGHARLLAVTVNGTVRAKTIHGDKILPLHEGFLEINNDKVVIFQKEL